MLTVVPKMVGLFHILFLLLCGACCARAAGLDVRLTLVTRRWAGGLQLAGPMQVLPARRGRQQWRLALADGCRHGDMAACRCSEAQMGVDGRPFDQISVGSSHTGVAGGEGCATRAQRSPFRSRLPATRQGRFAQGILPCLWSRFAATCRHALTVGCDRETARSS